MKENCRTGILNLYMLCLQYFFSYLDDIGESGVIANTYTEKIF